MKFIYSAESTRDPVKVQMSQKTRYRCCFNGRKYFTNIFSNTAELTPLDHTFEPPKFRVLSCYVNRTVMKSTFLLSNPDFNVVEKAKNVSQIIFNVLQGIKNSSSFRFPWPDSRSNDIFSSIPVSCVFNTSLIHLLCV